MQDLYNPRFSSALFAIALITLFACFAPFSTQSSQSQSHAATTLAAQNAPPFHIASAGPTTGNATNAPSASAPYDEQIGMTFTQDFTSLAYNVTAVEQQDQNGYGPAYLLNGLTDVGYWYQIGLSWNWPELSGEYDAGFHANYNVFNSAGNVVLPASGSGGSINFSGAVNQDDSVGLNLYFSSGTVVMSAEDWNTGATAQITYSSEDASQFVGLPELADSNGFFTGLMTEQYHESVYTGSELKVLYSDTPSALSSAILWIEEFNANTEQVLFHGNSPEISFSSNPTQLQTYSLQGATESANANDFVTGSVNSVELTLSYSVTSGAGYTAPTFSYVSDGFQQSANLSTSPTIYSIDSGTSWSVTNQLLGSTSTERWITNQTTSGTATSSQTISFLYYEQFFVTFAYSVADGGSGYSPPAVTAVQFGSTLSPTLGQKLWVDAGSQYSYTNPLSGSTQTERWQASNSSSVTGQISSPTTISPIYYHQFPINARFTVANGGTPLLGPTFDSEYFGATRSSTLTTTSTSYWIDAGSNYNVSTTITASQERWITNSSAAGTVTPQLSLNFIYNHQYYLSIQSSVPAGGTVSPQSAWVNAGTNISISNASTLGWKFEFWTGSGSGSYTGNANTTTLDVQSPITENATFYAGLTIGVTAGGSISYSYGNSGSQKVTAQSEVYVPAGTGVTLNANPSSFLDKLDSWSGAATGNSGETSVTVTSPSTVEAQFGYNLVIIGGIAAAAVIIVAAVTAVLARRGKPS